jgi:hypothetical protein
MIECSINASCMIALRALQDKASCSPKRRMVDRRSGPAATRRTIEAGQAVERPGISVVQAGHIATNHSRAVRPKPMGMTRRGPEMGILLRDCHGRDADGGDGILAINAFVSAQDDHILLFAPSSSFIGHPYNTTICRTNRMISPLSHECLIP